MNEDQQPATILRVSVSPCPLHRHLIDLQHPGYSVRLVAGCRRCVVTGPDEPTPSRGGWRYLAGVERWRRELRAAQARL